MHPALDGSHIELLAGGVAVVNTWRFDTATSTWSKRSDNTPEWSDASLWNDSSTSSTMPLALPDALPILLARGDAGVDTWRFDTATSAWSKRSDNTPEWSDASGWNDSSN